MRKSPANVDLQTWEYLAKESCVWGSLQINAIPIPINKQGYILTTSRRSSSLLVIADFDRTITAFRGPNGEPCDECHDIVFDRSSPSSIWPANVKVCLSSRSHTHTHAHMHTHKHKDVYKLICIHTYICISLSGLFSLARFLSLSLSVSICLSVCDCVCLCVPMCGYVTACVCICACLWVCVCVYICKYVHIHIHTYMFIHVQLKYP